MTELTSMDVRLDVDDEIPADTKRRIASIAETLDIESFLPSASVAPLAGGASNENFLLTSSAGKAVLRVAADLRHSERFALDRWSGFVAHQAAAKVGVAPQLLAIALPTGHSVVEFVDGTLVTADFIRTGEVLEECVLSLRRVHSGAPVKCREFNGLAEINRFVEICTREGIQMPEDIAELHRLSQQIEDVFIAVSAPKVLCHNDVQLANLIRSPDSDHVWVIDWEYGGIGNVYFDLSMLINNAELDNEFTARAFTAYFGIDRPCDHARVQLNRFQSAMREALWSLVAKPVLTNSNWDYDAWAERFFTYAREIRQDIADHHFLALAEPVADDRSIFERTLG